MSLRVWLPLNGNIENKGCSGLTFSTVSTNTAVSTSGKIGSCYANDSFNAGGLVSDTTIELGQHQSMFCWFMFTGLNSGSGLGGGLVSQHRHTANSGMGITIKYVSATTGYLSVNTGNGSNRTFNAYYGTTLLQANTWYHGGYTYDGTKIRIYVNGVCEKEQAYTGMLVPADYVTTFCWSFNSSTGSTPYGNYKFKGSLNDVRVYDHTLSLSEIKALSMGLVCHYKLDEPLAIDNLIRNSSYVVYNNYANSGCTATLVDTGNMYDNCKIYRLTYTPDSSHLSNVQTSLANHGIYGFRRTFSANTKYCFWILWRPITHPDTVCGGTASNISGWTEIPTSKYNDEWNIVGQCRKGNVTTDKTDNIFTSFKTPSATAGTPIIIEFCCPHLVSGYDYILPEYDYLGTVPAVCDSSGYGYHGIKNGGINISTNTARHNLCTSFDGDVSSIKIPFNEMLGLTSAAKVNYTISVWTYKTAIGTKNYQTILGGPSGFELEARNTSSTSPAYRIHNWGGGTAVYEFDKWNLFTFVHTASDSKLYVNGELKVTGTAANVPIGNFFVGAWRDTNSQNYDGLMSDFRVYATALSADDVLHLYNTAASIANNGSMFAYQLKEG